MTFRPFLRVAALAAFLPLLASQQAVSVQSDPRGPGPEAEAAFAELLTNARLVGFTTITGMEGLKADSYTLTRVSKQDDGKWFFEAKIEFGGTAIPMGLALPVEWAGTTPVITVDDMGFPMMGKYSARVLFHDDRYVGVWHGSSGSGEMFGRVERMGDESLPEATPGGSGGKPAGEGDDGAKGDDDEGTARAHDASSDGSWPSFRGRGGRGIADGFKTPVTWDIDSGEHVRYQVDVPGLAHSSPVIHGDKLFVTSAVRLDGDQELRVGLYGSIDPVVDDSEFGFLLFCYDKNTGELLWEEAAWEGKPAIARHPKGSHAASTPACDDERVVAFFGSEGLYCYDHDGKLLWKQDFGVLDSGFFLVKAAQWGFASSPILHDDKVVIQVDVQGQSFVALLDARTGKEIWRTNREEVPTWSTPTVDVRAGRSQVICNGWKHIGGYDLATGEELWKLEGGGDIPVPTPVVAHDLIYITNAHGRLAPIYAIDVNATGKLEADPEKCAAMAWSHDRRGIYMQTPIVYGDEAYFCSDAGIVGCFDALSGEEIYRERLGEGRTGFTGSGIAADGKLYFTSEEGDVYVVRAGRTFEVLATNPLGEEFMSSPVASEGTLYFRSRRMLTAVSL